MKEIIIKKIDSEWYADFCGDEEIQSLFGTTCLPCGFGGSVEPDVVLDVVRAKNPDCFIRLAI